MELLLQRQPAIDGALPGDLSIDGVWAYFTMERAAVAIASGRYRVRLTVSTRAMIGQLWSPDPDDRLPLIENVSGRSGLRFHALNEAAESDGCIGVGQQRMGVTIRRSRPALFDFMATLAAAEKAHEEIWLTIENAKREAPLKA